MRLGVLGGTFNPPHIGHLIAAQEALAQLSLDRVLFVPAGVPPHRAVEHEPGAEARFELTELAVAGDERFEASRIELDREGPSFTVETLRQLAAAGDDELFLLLGGDQATALPKWREPEEVLRLATVVAFERTNWSREGIGLTIARLRGARGVLYLDMPRIQVSSTLVRRRVREGRPIRYLVPDGVWRYIEEHRLYAGGAPAAATALRAGGR